MKVLVVGGTGLVGSFLLQRLVQNGHHVDAVTRDPSRLGALGGNVRSIVADVAQEDWLLRSMSLLADYDVVYHLAYATTGDPNYDRAVTVDSVRTLVTALRALTDNRLRHFVYTGSMVVYGANPMEQIVRETSAKSGDTVYAENKIAATRYALQGSPSLLCTVLHPTGVYAEHSARIKYYRELLAHNYVPNQLSKRSVNNIVYAGDLAAALLQCLDRPRERIAEEYIISGEAKLFVEWFDELGTTVRNRAWIRLPAFMRYLCRGVVRRFLNLLGVGCPLPLAEKRGSVFEQEVIYNSDKARTDFGFKPQMSFREVCERLRAENAA